jgi:D-alanyl-D-alanine carboxypeptidase
MEYIYKYIDRITERMIIIFTAGMLSGALGVLLQAYVIHTFISIPHTFKPHPADLSVFEQILPKLKGKTSLFSLTQKPTPSIYVVPPPINEANAYTVTDFDTGILLAEKAADKAVPIASLTKIMSAIVTLDLAKADEEYSISNRAASVQPTKIGVIPGERMRVDELLTALLVTSANDAAEVLREGIDVKYQSPVFVRAMNEKAKFLGLTHTHFDNPQGFDSQDNYSTARDLTVLSHYALSQYPLIAEIVKKDYAYLPSTSHHKQFDLYNWNGLLGVYPGVSGIKIGNTDAAGKTTIVVANRNNKQILVVLLGAPDLLKRDMWAAQLLDVGYQIASGSTPINITSQQLQQKYASWKYWN